MRHKFAGVTFALIAFLSADVIAQQQGEFKNSPSSKKKLFVDEKPLVKITGGGFIYCTSDQKCEWTSTFRIGEKPVSIGIALESQPSVKGKSLDFSWKIKDLSTNQIVFEDYSDGTVDYVPFQRMRYQYPEIPHELTALNKEGKYRLYINVISADGTVFSENNFPMRARQIVPELAGNKVISEWGECITVSTGTDEGAINCALGILASPSRNGSTSAAFDNLNTCLSARRTATILGHASAGEICTGDGNHCGGDNNTIITSKNGAKWIPSASTIKDKASGLMIAGCHAGAGEDGATLLYKVAQATNTNVGAPTGLIHCSPSQKRMWIDGVWQIATPTNKPSPIQAPTYTVSPNKFGYFSIDANKIKIDINQFKIASISLFVAGKPVQVKEQYRLNAFDTLAMIDFAHPAVTDTLLFATVTGEIQIDVSRSSAESRTKTFKILANSVLQDLEEPTYYYHIDSKLQERLASAIDFLSNR